MSDGAPSTFSFGSSSNSNNQNSFQTPQTSFGVTPNATFGNNPQPSFGNNQFAVSPNINRPANTAWTNQTPSNMNAFSMASSGTFASTSTTAFGQSHFGSATSGSGNISTSGFVNSRNTFHTNATTPSTTSFQSPFGTSSNISLQKPFFQSSTNFGMESLGNSSTPFGYKPATTTDASSAFRLPENTKNAPSSMFSSNNGNVNSFGVSSTSLRPTVVFEASSNVLPNPFASSFPTNSGGIKNPEQKPKPMFGNIVYTPKHRTSTNVDENTDVTAKQDKLAELKAKLEEKKRKMMEIKMRQGQDQQMEEDGTNETSDYSLNPAAPVFVPKQSKGVSRPITKERPVSFGDRLNSNKKSFLGMNERIPRKSKQSSVPVETETEQQNDEILIHQRLVERNKSRFGIQVEKQNDDNDNKDRNKLAERNASRFATQQNRTSVSYLPDDLVERAKNYHPSQSASRETDHQTHDDEELNYLSKKSLVGTCLQMCPDEELVRRESEGDIQMLELPHADIYPKGYTLRDTAVKRFRRSAADFKLDIPELIRPPYVLEKVCGYLEEYVMERDRQGIDPRFGQVPSPLDVYQFIWDRTRMVRKDFILQNFIGTGGRCNATAVRCHERIARWHAMMEHQLAHIPEFIKNQSQQNIQELGQTMKTLNFYYDDSDKRADLEDDSTDTGNITHGCSFSSVRGPNPCDYNGNSLSNSDDHTCVSRRFIGNLSCSGICEEEMRGLYILLTINNDGGMEVLKYAARLSRDRPAIFNSESVQFALEVYKARKEYNYAKFFTLLRSPKTPYLYACIMFKYVETMRKACFKIMARTYGFKKRDTNEALNDDYPLQKLVHLLCFEDLNEASAACRHYNITCEKVSSSGNTSKTIDTIFWRRTEFKEPQDPSKGVVIPLRPWKMNRTIESKLGGATRLAVCRGEVSEVTCTSTYTKTMAERHIDQSADTEGKKHEEFLEQNRVEDDKKKIIEEAIIREEEYRRQKKNYQQKEQEQEQEQNRLVELRKKEEYLRALELENLERQKEAVIRKEEERRKALEEAHKREKEEEFLRIQRIEQERIQKEKEREIQAIQDIKRKQQETERQIRIQRDADEKIRRAQEEEIRRQKDDEKKRRDELERKLREKEEADRLLELEWVSKINFAKKLATLKKWMLVYENSRGRKVQTYRTIEDLDAFPTAALRAKDDCYFIKSGATAISQQSPISFEEKLYRLGTVSQEKIDLSRCYIDTLMMQNIPRRVSNMKLSEVGLRSKNTFLFKLGLRVSTDCATSLTEVIEFWLDSRLHLNIVQTSIDVETEFRLMVRICDENDLYDANYDGILRIGTSAAANDLQCDFPDVTITFDEMQKCEDLDLLLTSACLEVFDHAVHDIGTKSIEKISLPQLISVLLAKTMFSFPNEVENLFMLPYHSQRKAIKELPEIFLMNCMRVINFAQNELLIFIGRCNQPYRDFAVGSSIPRYFSDDGDDLPLHWKQITATNFNQDTLDRFLLRPRDKALGFRDFIHGILRKAPSLIHLECLSHLESNDFLKCISVALTWIASNGEFGPIYLPVGTVKDIVDTYLESIPPPSYRKLVNIDTFIETREIDQDRYGSELGLQYTEPIRPPTSSKRILKDSANEPNERKKQKTEKRDLISNELSQCKSFTARLKDAVYSDQVLMDFIQKDDTLTSLLSEMPN